MVGWGGGADWREVGVGSADLLIAMGCGEGTLLALLSPANRGSLAFTCGLYMLICEVAVGLELLVEA